MRFLNLVMLNFSREKNKTFLNIYNAGIISFMSERLSPKPGVINPQENTPPIQEEIKTYFSQLIEEYEREREENGLENRTGMSYVRFTSRSNGRNRNRRTPREVEIIRHNGRCAQIEDDGSHSPLDEWAQEAGMESANELVWAFRDEHDRNKER